MNAKYIIGGVAMFAAGFIGGVIFSKYYDIGWKKDDEPPRTPVWLEDDEPEEEPESEHIIIPQKPSLEKTLEELECKKEKPIEVISEEELNEEACELVTYFYDQGVVYVDGSDEMWSMDEFPNYIGTPFDWRMDPTELEDEMVIWVRNHNLEMDYEITIRRDELPLLPLREDCE